MKEGNRVRVINGKHKGETGEIIGPYIVEGLGTIGEKALENLKGRWFVQLDGSNEQDILKEEELDITS
ncbi:KOW motif-containing protein [Chloroflexota bacterium]